MKLKPIISISALSACLIGSPILVSANLMAEKRSNFFVVDSNLSSVLDALKEFSDARIDFTDEVRGRVQRRDFDGTLPEILDALAISHDLEWFHFNGAYYVSQSREAISRIVRLGNLPVASLEAAMKGAGLTSDTLSTTTTSNGEAIVLTGPPKLVAFAEVIIESIPDAQLTATPVKQIRIRRGSGMTVEYSAEAKVSQ
jgi:hypothetical protein